MNRNKPYVKKYDKEGVLLNPIKGIYRNPFPSRRQRNIEKKQSRFMNNSKSYPLSVYKTSKYSKHIQLERNKDGGLIRIEHYQLQ